MGDFILKDLILKKKNKLILVSVLYSVILILIGGNISIINESKTNLIEITKESVINECFSLNYFKYIFLLIMYSLTSLVFLKEKDNDLEGKVSDLVTAKQVLFSNILELMIPITMALTLNTVIKIIVYFANYNILNNQLKVPFLIIITSYIFNILLFLIYVVIIYIAHLGIKDLFVAAIYPIFMIEGIFAIFGAGTLLLSNKLRLLKTILYPISDIVMLAITKIFYNDIRFEGQSIVLQFLIMLLLVTILVLFFVWAYETLNRINTDNINKSYRFKFFQVTFYILIAYFISFCILGLLPYVIPNTNKINLDILILCFNLISFALMPLIYYLLKKNNKRKTLNKINKVEENKIAIIP